MSMASIGNNLPVRFHEDMDQAQRILDYRFNDPKLLFSALFKSDPKVHQALEQCGDVVLTSLVCQEVLDALEWPKNCAPVRRTADQFTRNPSLEEYAGRCGFKALVKPYLTGSDVADFVEATIAAIAIDGGYFAAKKSARIFFGDDLDCHRLRARCDPEEYTLSGTKHDQAWDNRATVWKDGRRMAALQRMIQEVTPPDSLEFDLPEEIPWPLMSLFIAAACKEAPSEKYNRTHLELLGENAVKAEFFIDHWEAPLDFASVGIDQYRRMMLRGFFDHHFETDVARCNFEDLSFKPSSNNKTELFKAFMGVWVAYGCIGVVKPVYDWLREGSR